MNAETISFEIPRDLLAALKIGADDLGKNVRLLAAIAYFREKKLSLGKAAEFAGINRLDFMDILCQQKIVLFDYDESFLTAELEGITKLRVEQDDYQ